MCILTHCSQETPKRIIGKQCRPRSAATEPAYYDIEMFASFSLGDVPKIEIGLFQYKVWGSLFSLQWDYIQ